MTTATFNQAQYAHSGRRAQMSGIHVGRIGLGSIGLLTVLISAWGGIIPYVGPTFGFSADGTGSWYWSLTHAVLALIPGAVGVLAGLALLTRTRGLTVGRGRMSLAMVGFIAALCGAWFTIGPWAWAVLNGSGSYFVIASPLRALSNLVGYALGPGLILAACGAFAIGWASRHQSKVVESVDVASDAVPRPAVTDATAPVDPEASGTSGRPDDRFRQAG